MSFREDSSVMTAARTSGAANVCKVGTGHEVKMGGQMGHPLLCMKKGVGHKKKSTHYKGGGSCVKHALI